jgi:hypothetical protein
LFVALHLGWFSYNTYDILRDQSELQFNSISRT